MQKKPGQISANTLSLRFMQNAAKAKEEKEVEAAKAKVKSQEEWEISQSVRQGWGLPDSVATEQGTVTYEQSYLPFLFPTLSSTNAAAVATTGTRTRAKLFQGDEGCEQVVPHIPMRGRRTFGKHGQEESIADHSPEPPRPSSSVGGVKELPRGARGISSHGHAAATLFNTASNPTISRPALPPTKQSIVAITTATSVAQSPPVFMKPQVEVPRAESGQRKKRSSADVGDKEEGQRKKKKKQKDQNF